MDDPNRIICTGVHSASVELLSDEEIRRLSCCRITTAAALVSTDGTGPAATAVSAGGGFMAVPGGLHDPRLGPLDGRDVCQTCGLSGSCLGHLGHIELHLPALQPLLLPGLVRLLKMVCFQCQRVRQSSIKTSLVVKRFELLQLLMPQELQTLDNMTFASGRGSTKYGGEKKEDSSQWRTQLVELFASVDEELSVRMRREKVQRNSCADSESDGDDAASLRQSFLLQHLPRDLSRSNWQVTTWREMRKKVFEEAATVGRCSHCGIQNAVSVHLSSKGSGIELRWPWRESLPYGSNSFLGSLFAGNGASLAGAAQSTKETNGEFATAPETSAKSSAGFNGDRVKPDDSCLKYWKNGKAIGSVQLQGFQLLPLVESLFSKDEDRRLFNYLFPMSVRLGAHVFFMKCVAVSANKFRLPIAGSVGSPAAGRLLLHPRTQQLRDLLVINEKLKFALAVLNHPDPLNAVRDSKSLMRLLQHGGRQETSAGQDEESAFEDDLTAEQQQLIQEFIIQHAAGGGSWLSTYALQQQLKLNELVDSTRAEKPQGAPPGIRQWMEKKQGAIRQKMMGKRVNYAARTVLAPDGLLGSNEVGVPLEFAMKLSVPEPVTGRNAYLLSKMVENGPFQHPGALGLEDQHGVVYNLEVMPAAARRAKAQQILNLATSTEDGRSFRVFRHLLDGDVVLMNRQPSLHRLSLMAHFVSITRPLSSKYNINTFLDSNGLRKKSGGYKKVTKAMMVKQRREDELEQQQDELQLQKRDALAAKSAAANKEKGLMERVFRLNFVNCSSYNADFDGDEMNMHVPQDPIARAEAAYILNADAQFAVPKNGDIVRGLIQDFCLAGCLLTCRDTLLDIHQFQNLVFSAVGNYVNSHGSVLVLDRTKRLNNCCSAGTPAATATAAAAASTEFAAVGLGAGDPYKRQLIAAAGGASEVVSGLNIHLEPPAIVHPRRLWTGKQVVTTVLKTLVDGIAKARLRRVCWKKEDAEAAVSGYRGINLTATSKTPGDAWGGVEDGDKEESSVIIRDSELLQGVFDKNQFGSSSGGLLHLVFLLFGSAASSLLLQALASLFCCFLKMHGATTSPADFVMTHEGEQQRQALVHRIVRAGTFLQEHFASRISALMGWSFDSAKQKLRRHVSSVSSVVAALGQKRAGGSTAADAAAMGVKVERTDGPLDDVAVAVQELSAADKSASGIEERSHVLLRMALDSKPRGSATASLQNGSAETVQLEKLRLARLADAAAELVRSAHQMKGTSGLGSKTEEDASLCLDPWMLLRQQKHTSIATAQQPTAANSTEQLTNLIQIMERMQNSPVQRMQLLQLLSCSPLLQQQLPRVSNILKASRLLSPATPRRLENDHCTVDQSKYQPSPNVIVSLPDGGFLEGRASLLRAKLRHPSWLWSGATAKRRSSTAGAIVASSEFESTGRYVLQSASAVAASANQRHMRAFLEPSEITKARIGSVYEDHFLGMAEMFDEMLDSYFQSSLAKVASHSTEIMKGRFFLNRFPRNGFASMIKSGSKGSNVNFAMICVFLGQQSLEGRRVKVMASGRSLPSFATADFGAMARGFVLSSFLKGLREEEFYFHCMAGREGLIDTAVKTAKSGYLQRSLMKSLESLRLSYDGSVRDQDGSIVQFVYGDDGRDPANAATFKHIELLFDNPYLLKRLNPPPAELHANVEAQNAALGTHRRTGKDEDLNTPGASIDEDAYLNHTWTRPFDSPLCAIGTTSLKYEQELGGTVDKIFQKYAAARKAHLLSGPRKNRKKKQKQQESDDNFGLVKSDLESLMRVVFHKSCMKPGESVGCVAAQSIGEPATQMTLNTFHLAGHGAANVTMGIPRLRELLQLGARTQTPQIYIPLLHGGDSLPNQVREQILAQNAATVMRGFTTIQMQDFIHAVGVEANVFYQFVSTQSACTRGGCPMIPPGQSGQYWEYDVTLQLEPLSHFCAVYKHFHPSDLIHLVLKKVVRAFLRKVRKLMAAYVAHYGSSNPHVAQSDMEAFFQEFICQDRLKTHWDKRAEVRDILRSGNLAGGEAPASSDTFGERQSISKRSLALADDEENGGTRPDATKDETNENEKVKALKREREVHDEEPQEDDASCLEARPVALSENEQGQVVNSVNTASEDESEESDEEKALAEDLDVDAGESEAEELDSKGRARSEQSDINRKRKGIKSEPQRDESGSSSDSAEEENTTQDVKREREEPAQACSKSKRVRSTSCEKPVLESGTPVLNLADLLVGKVFDRKARIFVDNVRNTSENQCGSYTPFEAQAAPIEYDAVWGSGGKTVGLVSLDPESASILHDIKICTTSWRVVVKFGWPTKKCPYRLEVLPLLKALIEKCTLQAPEGVTAARIVQGSGCVTGNRMEVHCDGSNLRWIHKLKETAVDHNRIATNDVVAILKFYGVEAARAAFIKELKSVFGAYGIQLGGAHLKIVADYVTNDGTLTAFNRLGIGSSSSPFLQMSFETSFKFLTEACERAAVDNLQSPSGSLFVGTPAAIGSQQSALLAVLPDF